MDLDGCLSIEDAGDDDRMGCVIVIACAGAAEARAEREVEPISRVPCCFVCIVLRKNFWELIEATGHAWGVKLRLTLKPGAGLDRAY